MNCNECVELVGELVDGTAYPDVEQAVRRHLDSCASCRALLEDLSRIRTAAAALGPIEPSPQVWAAVQAGLRPYGAQGRESWALWRPLAAAAGFVLVASSLGWVASRLAALSPAAVVVEAQPAGAFELAEAAYQAAIDDLETAADGEASLVAERALVTLQAGLADLDQVIVETRDQLAREPDDAFSQDSLLAALDSKVALLQDTLALLDQGNTDQGANP